MLATTDDELDRRRAAVAKRLHAAVDPPLLQECARWTQRATRLYAQVLQTRPAQAVSASVVGHRQCFVQGRRFVEYELVIETDWRGAQRAWHRYSTFRSLAASLHAPLPKLPATHLFGAHSDRTIETRKERLNAFLAALLRDTTLQWCLRMADGNRVGRRKTKQVLPLDALRALHVEASRGGEAARLAAVDAACAAGSAPAFVAAEIGRLQQRVELLTSVLGLHGGVTLATARIVDARWIPHSRLTQYRIQIETPERGALSAWFRHETFLQLAASLSAKYGPGIPTLEAEKHLPRCLDRRMARLNAFLAAILELSAVEWAIRIDEATCVVKPANPSQRPSSASTVSDDDDGWP
ncbi:hypothetical protein SPRG_08009 [Saprolegnia parasitica CBS 223.65]|uniref:PX domain-containing protein n=1 Tax=Saprolegnia parasitica (strain CBS 223.65) TaxID=695850 RepID=A0A067CBP5_SAPPC|nr:hypothetical protein SPRG_08009 [Saprolegnia parasitica CBS 223.65]KDO26605.1 hypothetical protein SPRG_08009 [Saprolegnia parasitica CBS 223.65]|eukprot:XP_012202747.1 hypothetical protein SPRG_08009 [Saprolegnia parasitica CBS 223.65]